MFLYLSKLLPLLVYPVGIACVCLILCLWWIWRQQRTWAMGSAAIALLVLLIGSNAWVSTNLVKSLEWRHLPPEPMPTADAIVVLGGSTRPADYPRPWVDLLQSGDRILHGAQLYNAGKAPKLILSGGRIEWKGGGPSESEDMAQVAIAMGVPRTDILQEPTSLNTYQNAVNVRTIVEREGFETILLVTSAMHMPRALAIFQKQGMNAIAAPTDFIVSERSLKELQGTGQGFLLNLLPNAANLHELSLAIKEYIGFIVYRLRGWL